MKGMTAMALIYISCCAAIAVAIYVTKSAFPLWALKLIPDYKSGN